MRELGLGALPARGPGARPPPDPGPGRADPDLVNADFTSRHRARRWSATLPTSDLGRLAFLATVIDCATRKVIGWGNRRPNYKTPLITAAIKMAARNLDLLPVRSFIRTAAAITRPLSSALSWPAWISASPSAAPASARQCARRVIQRAIKSSGCTAPSTRQGEKQPKTLHGTSSSVQ